VAEVGAGKLARPSYVDACTTRPLVARAGKRGGGLSAGTGAVSGGRMKSAGLCLPRADLHSAGEKLESRAAVASAA